MTPLRATPPANLTQPCDPLVPFDGQTMGELLRYTVGTIQQYRDCAARHESLSEWERARK